jgi:hypothetical protein
VNALPKVDLSIEVLKIFGLHSRERKLERERKRREEFI